MSYPLCSQPMQRVTERTTTGMVAILRCTDPTCTGRVGPPPVRPPRYAVDYEAVSTASDPLAAIEAIADHLSRPGFDRSVLCARCEGWRGVGRPARPFASDPLGPGGSCSGCVLSHLDLVSGDEGGRAGGRRQVLVARYDEAPR